MPKKKPDVIVPPRIAELNGLAAREGTQLRRQFDRFRHGCTFNQYRNREQLSLERSVDLHSDIVTVAVETTTALFIDGRQPPPANHREHDVAGLKFLVDCFDEIVARLKRVNIDENILSAELPGKAVVEAAGVAGRVVSPITDENGRHS